MAEEVHVHERGDSSAGWVVAILLIVVLAIVGWFVFVRGGEDRDVNIDVTVPAEVEQPPRPPN